MAIYEVKHPDADYPHPRFDTWKDALAAQKEWNKDCPGHKARKIPDSEIPIEITCSCGEVYIGWPDQKNSECIDCYVARTENQKLSAGRE